MGATPPSWRVGVKAGDTVSVHATYDTRRADWYEVMGIMAVAVYDGTLSGSQDAQAGDCPTTGPPPSGCIPQDAGPDPRASAARTTTTGAADGAPDPLSLWSCTGAEQQDQHLSPSRTTEIRTPARACRRSSPGRRSPSTTATRIPSVNDPYAFHTITACKDPCNGTTGIAYPIANGPVTFDSGELGYNGNGGSFGRRSGLRYRHLEDARAICRPAPTRTSAGFIRS